MTEPCRVMVRSMSTGLGVTHVDALGTPLSLPPLAFEHVASRVLRVEALDVEILIIGTRVRDAPRNPLVVTEVGESWDAAEGHADDVELRTGEVVLVVDVGHVDGAMRVTGDQRFAAGGATSVNSPVVAAVEPFADS